MTAIRQGCDKKNVRFLAWAAELLAFVKERVPFTHYNDEAW
jgi:hypothetical protein